MLCNGELALLRTDCDICAALARWRTEARKSGFPGQPPDLAEARLRLSTFDGVRENAGIEVPAGRWPRVDRLPDGRWLVVSPPTEPPYDIDARIHAADGALAGAFATGGYTTDVQCSVDGTFWAGYSDEGVYCGPDVAGAPAVSSAGIVHFDADGAVIWRFNDEAGSNLYVDHCYTLTLDGAALWTCSYSDFPIVRVAQGVATPWLNRIGGASALAVDGDHVLLAGGYKGEASRLALLHLVDGEARLEGQWRLAMPDWSAPGLVQGRDDTLHLVGNGQWRRITVAELRARRGRNDYQPDQPA